MTNRTVDMLEIARVAQATDLRPFSAPGSIRLMAPAKVNLYLNIGERRADGYHMATSIMHALMLHDVLYMRRESTCEPARDPASEPACGSGLSVRLTCRAHEGLQPLDVPVERNIVTKAIRLLARMTDRHEAETMVVHVEKHIPAEAGLGGGSSDAAAALVGAAHLWGLASDDPRIEAAARELGADVAFFLHGGCSSFVGVGDEFVRDLEPMKSAVALIKPDGGVSTAEAYRAFDDAPVRLDEAEHRAVLQIARAADVPLRNNLVPASEQLLPVLAEIRSWAQQRDGVQQVLMSGSGSAVFACCESFAAASHVASDAAARGWWSRATMFGPARAALVPLR